MEQRAFKNVSYCWNTNISFYLDSDLYLNVVHFFNTEAGAAVAHLVVIQVFYPALLSNTSDTAIDTMFCFLVTEAPEE